MVNSEAIFLRVTGIDTLLSFDGIILSLPDFQLKLINLIDLLSKSLLAEGQCEQLSDNLCHSICCYMDNHISLNLSMNSLSWQRYSLEHHYYGYENQKECLVDKLAPLLANSEGPVFTCAYQLLVLIEASIPGNPDITALLARYRLPKKIAGPEKMPAEAAVELSPPATPRTANGKFLLQLAMLATGLLIFWLFCSAYLNGLS